MAQILRDLPFYKDQQLFYREPSLRPVSIGPRQIPIRVCLGVYLEHESAFSRSPATFPAILDTGFNGALLLTTFHLSEWAGIATEHLGREIQVTERPDKLRGFRHQRFDGQFYIVGNRRNSWDSAGSYYAVPTTIILLHALEADFSLPLIGTEALELLEKRVVLDYRTNLVQV